LSRARQWGEDAASLERSRNNRKEEGGRGGGRERRLVGESGGGIQFLDVFTVPHPGSCEAMLSSNSTSWVSINFLLRVLSYSYSLIPF
jgi:hypothetical protein